MVWEFYMGIGVGWVVCETMHIALAIVAEKRARKRETENGELQFLEAGLQKAQADLIAMETANARTAARLENHERRLCEIAQRLNKARLTFDERA